MWIAELIRGAFDACFRGAEEGTVSPALIRKGEKELEKAQKQIMDYIAVLEKARNEQGGEEAKLKDSLEKISLQQGEYKEILKLCKVSPEAVPVAMKRLEIIKKMQAEAERFKAQLKIREMECGNGLAEAQLAQGSLRVQKAELDNIKLSYYRQKAEGGPVTMRWDYGKYIEELRFAVRVQDHVKSLRSELNMDNESQDAFSDEELRKQVMTDMVMLDMRNE
ncbi:MAG: hypothetical protein J6Y62_07055 [Clostridia bacterium]|nr:hypothetical protein [Clostridia bacterium]